MLAKLNEIVAILLNSKTKQEELFAAQELAKYFQELLVEQLPKKEFSAITLNLSVLA